MMARRAWPLLLLALFSGAGSGRPSATAMPADPPSIIVAEWIGRTATRTPPDCFDNGNVCTTFIVDARISVLGTLAGPRVPSPLTVRFRSGWFPSRGVRVPLLVAPGRRRGAWPAFMLEWSESGRDVCVDESSLSEFGVTTPPGGRHQGDMLCYRAYS